jgi:hypothetical protein
VFSSKCTASLWSSRISRIAQLLSMRNTGPKTFTTIAQVPVLHPLAAYVIMVGALNYIAMVVAYSMWDSRMLGLVRWFEDVNSFTRLLLWICVFPDALLLDIFVFCTRLIEYITIYVLPHRDIEWRCELIGDQSPALNILCLPRFTVENR